MKHILFCLLLLVTVGIKAQNTIVPNKNILGGLQLQDRHFDLDWNMIVEGNKTNVGTLHLDMILKNNEYIIITTTKLAKFPNSHWIDSSVCDNHTLSPIYHSSYNMQRDMVLYFGKHVEGYYLNKQNDSLTHIADTLYSPYFDSNLYTWFMSLLPLHKGMTIKLPLYDYNPAKSGLMHAVIKDVKEGNYVSAVSGNHKVWIINTEDDVSGSSNSLVFYIDQKDKTYWKIEAQVGNRKMEQVFHE